MTGTYHKPVLISEVLTYMAPKPGGVYVDATFGGGGHTRALLEAEPRCTVIGVDWDAHALELNAAAIEADFPERFTPLWGNFAQLPFLLKKEGIEKVDGLLADFGTSQYQIAEQPGFSFSKNTQLDMRMSPAHQQYTAYDLVNHATEQELIYIFREYGEEWNARKIVQALALARKRSPIKTTGDLVAVIQTVVPRHKQKIHPATKVFQALRIAVNKELDNIHAFLIHSTQLLKPAGRVVCISFHSLEDRIVKTFFREHKNVLNILTPKVVTATPEERLANPSSRSAKLRAAQLILP